MIKKGTILGFLDGQVMPWAQYNEIMKNTDLGYFNSYIFMEWNALDKNTLLVRAFRTKYSYINHSRKPNVAIKYNRNTGLQLKYKSLRSAREPKT